MTGYIVVIIIVINYINNIEVGGGRSKFVCWKVKLEYKTWMVNYSPYRVKEAGVCKTVIDLCGGVG